jgi:bifunctional non-homologous end joining protein LigD
MKNKLIVIGSHTLEITHPDKLIFPDDNISKAEFVDYYYRVSQIMLPHLKGRPVNMHRFMNGIKGEGFYQQAIPDDAPEWVHQVSVKKAGGTVNHIVCDDAATLIYMANHDCITLHAWLSRVEQPEKPDQMIFDLDPPGEDFEPVRQGAKKLKKLLDDIGLTAFLKTTGSHGLHVVIPLRRILEFEPVRDFARGVAEILVRREPEIFTTEQRKDKRRNRLFVDTLRNAYAHTAVAPYAVRAIRGAPVAAPLFWEELDEPDLTAQRYHIRNLEKRWENSGDPWKDMESQAQTLGKSQKLLSEWLDLK